MQACRLRPQLGLVAHQRTLTSYPIPRKLQWIAQRAKSSKAKQAPNAIPKPAAAAARAESTHSGNAHLPKHTNVLRESEQLGWAEYFKIRRSRRLWQNIMTVPTSLAGLIGGAMYFGSLDTDPLKPVMGIDPFMFYGVCTAGCMGVGFILGPTVGTSIWRLTHKSLVPLIDARDKRFFEHVARKRVPAELQSPTKPVPDYYGEKIGSLHEYRQWLRDQTKYRKRALLPED
ncbi:mitochondrial import protein Pam17-domain-containing protein [Schizophyllum amplum]|uniref:Presequence translocated-associated motor subunit PAM17 n=1 Tax=Schizophyllum amplum TaxID=97359 RepID=A0A550CHX4_9AGAR|nr:mitochondrial import protein Pam17-domain-containing protein [Auriculariopsis ampla]